MVEMEFMRQGHLFQVPYLDFSYNKMCVRACECVRARVKKNNCETFVFSSWCIGSNSTPTPRAPLQAESETREMTGSRIIINRGQARAKAEVHQAAYSRSVLLSI